MDDARSLRQQQLIAAMRDSLVNSAVTAEAKLKAEETSFQMLLEESPEKLAPVLIQRNHTDLVVAYLIQKIGDRAWRFLITGEHWRILRAKKSATVYYIPQELLEAFKQAVMVQGLCTSAIERLRQELKRRNNQHEPRAERQKQVRNGKAGAAKSRS